MRGFEEACVVKSTGEVLKFSEMTEEDNARFSNLKNLSGAMSIKDVNINDVDVTINIFDDEIDEDKTTKSITFKNFADLTNDEKNIVSQILV